MSTNVFADGGVGGGWESPGAGGLDSITGDGGNGGNAFFFGGAGGGGGGAGVSVGGAGGAGSYFGAGGTGGVSGTFPSGGLTSTNISGTQGGIGKDGPNAGGGGGAGGYGLIITNEFTLTNSAGVTISGGDGGAGGVGSGWSGSNGGSGGVGIYVNNISVTINNAGTIQGGAGGAGGSGSSTGATGSGGVGVYIGSTNTVLNNSGTIQGGAGATALYLGLSNSAAITNTGTITGGTGSVGISNDGTISTLTNNLSGTIQGVPGGINNASTGIITNLNNAGTIISSGMGADYGIFNAGTIVNLNNSSSLRGFHSGLNNNAGATIDTLTNQIGGTINGATAILNSGNIATLTNNGLITFLDTGLSNAGTIQVLTNIGQFVASYGTMILNTGTITTLNNLNGGVALTYTGNVPLNYNIIINSPTIFGRLAVTNPSGTYISFGIYTGSTVRNGTYSSVITGVPGSYFQTTSGRASGSYGSVSWSLSNSSLVSYIWDLTLSDYVEPVVIIVGPSVANTNQSLVNTASALQGTYTLQNSLLANSFSYDCTVFGANDVCVSAGGRNTQVQAANGLNNTSALLIAAYRPHPNYRIGAYADQNLSVSNPGGTVNLGNNTPLLGLFAAWNERLDGTGTEVKVSAAYGQKNTTITRSVVGSGDGASEAGSGSSKLNSQGAQVTAKYGFSVLPEVIVSPYVGVRYTSNTMGGYTEASSSSVTAPLTYSALNTNATTALAGVGASYRVIPTVMTFASAGVETDTNTANGTYTATNASIGTLTPVNFNANPVKTRPTATVGAYYDIEKNQRVGITGIYRQEAYQAVSTTTVMATYTIGL
ncbi:autotransporter outer membrane beta-barrel domain-containing protein [Polynucleobacter paneuropaeus]|nr:autotransporter outer membrane beta-barrel domain-containing protein [Polynucleobacter paneuropaeus]